MIEHVLSDTSYDLLAQINRRTANVSQCKGAAHMLTRVGYAVRDGDVLIVTPYGRTYRKTAQRWKDYIREQYGH